MPASLCKRVGTYQPRQHPVAFLVRAALREDAPVDKEEERAAQQPAASPAEEEQERASPPDLQPQPLEAKDAPHGPSWLGRLHAQQPVQQPEAGGGSMEISVAPTCSDLSLEPLQGSKYPPRTPRALLAQWPDLPCPWAVAGK